MNTTYLLACLLNSKRQWFINHVLICTVIFAAETNIMFLYTQAEYGWTMVDFTLFSAYESSMQCLGKHDKCEFKATTQTKIYSRNCNKHVFTYKDAEYP